MQTLQALTEDAKALAKGQIVPMTAAEDEVARVM